MNVVPGKKRKSASARRKQFLDAAIAIIASDGLAGLTTRTVAERVGVAQPTLFLHFGNKNTLLVAIVDAAEAKLRAGVAELDVSTMPAEEALRKLIKFHFRFVCSQPHLPRLLFSEELRTGETEVKDRMEEFVDFYKGVIAGIILTGQKAGVFNKNITPRMQAKLIVALLQGVAFRWVLDGSAGDLDEYSDPVINQLLYGLAVS